MAQRWDWADAQQVRWGDDGIGYDPIDWCDWDAPAELDDGSWIDDELHTPAPPVARARDPWDPFLDDPVGWHRQETIDDLRRRGPCATPDRTVRQIRGLTDSGWELICRTVGLSDEDLEAGLRIWDDPVIVRLMRRAARARGAPGSPASTPP